MAGTPNQESCKNTSYTPSITMHLFPTEPKCRAQWIKFVQRHRVDFGEPINRYASLCSAHFVPSCFENSPARSMGFKVKNNLVTGSNLTRHAVNPRGKEVFSDRRKCQVTVFRSICLFFTFTFSCTHEQLCKGFMQRLSHVKFEYCFGINNYKLQLTIFGKWITWSTCIIKFLCPGKWNIQLTVAKDIFFLCCGKHRLAMACCCPNPRSHTAIV